MEWHARIYRHADYYRVVVTDEWESEGEARYVVLVPLREYDRTPGWDGAEQAAVDMARFIGGEDTRIIHEYGE